MYYQGEAYSIDGIIKMLQSQGLIVDYDRAYHVLSNVSYTRLKNYLVFFMEDRDTHKFRPGTTFEDAYALYGFDRRLRELIFHEMEKIEISIRTRMAYASNGSEKGYWFLNPEHFKSKREHERILRHLKSELDRSDNEAIIHFRQKYTNEFPPSWLALEAASMGTLWNLYDSVSDFALRKNVASYYGMPTKIFSSWVKHLVEVRNDCAHHNRVWNGEPHYKAELPFGLDKPFPAMKEEDRNHIFMTLSIIKYFQDTIKPDNTFEQRLRTLLGNFKTYVDPTIMGFPEDW